MLRYFKKHKYTTRAVAYAFDVVKKHRLAGKYEILACQRFIDDLQAHPDHVYDVQKAERACMFIEKMPHTKGRWAARSQTIELEGWQCFVVCNLYGWVDENGMRRFREAYLKIPRKNGKSTLCAGIGHFMFSMDGEYGAEIYSGATNLKQAWEVFGPARQMAVMQSGYAHSKKIEIGAKNIHIISKNAKFEPLIGSPGDGANPSCAIVDEYHEHKSNDLVETMQTGMGAREQPLMIKITTAGSEMSGPCYDAELEAIKILEKVYDDEQQFILIFGIDEDDEWTDPKNLEKANPNIDISVSGEFLAAQLKQAIRNPLKQNAFRRKHLNQWVGAHTAWLNMADFLKCADEQMNIQDFVGMDCYIPVDLASKLDITATPKLFTNEIDGKTHYYYFASYFIPEETAFKEENTHYQKWIASGHLIATDGNEIDLNEIQESIKQDLDQFGAKEIVYDPWHAVQLAQALQQEGANIVEFRHTVANMSPAMYELEAAVTSGRFHYDGNPMTTWMASNVIAKVDAKENIYPRKQKPQNKIDGIVAAIMGIGRVVAEKEQAIDISDFINDPIAG
jgi:phage terminase large subunit-like protein